MSLWIISSLTWLVVDRIIDDGGFLMCKVLDKGSVLVADRDDMITLTEDPPSSCPIYDPSYPSDISRISLYESHTVFDVDSWLPKELGDDASHHWPNKKSRMCDDKIRLKRFDGIIMMPKCTLPETRYRKITHHLPRRKMISLTEIGVLIGYDSFGRRIGIWHTNIRCNDHRLAFRKRTQTMS